MYKSYFYDNHLKVKNNFQTIRNRRKFGKPFQAPLRYTNIKKWFPLTQPKGCNRGNAICRFIIRSRQTEKTKILCKCDYVKTCDSLYHTNQNVTTHDDV